MVNTTIGELRGNLAEYVDRVAQDKERIIVTRHGHEAVAIIPVADLKLIERVERQIDELIARAALAEIREQGAIPWEEAARRLVAHRPECR